jgi:glutaconate CoA-transferase subunit B
VKFADRLKETPRPTVLELSTLRDLKARTDAAHSGGAVAAGRGSKDG